MRKTFLLIIVSALFLVPARGDERPAITAQIAAARELLPDLPYDVKQWAIAMERGDFRDASDLWESIQLQIPDSFREMADAGFLYSLWRLDLPQTFLDFWLSQLPRKAFADSAALQAVEAAIQESFDTWLNDNALLLGPEQETVVTAAPERPVYQRLRAWAALRKPAAAATALKSLPAGHRWRPYLLSMWVFDATTHGDTKGAIAALQEHIMAQAGAADPMLTAPFRLELARLQYQAGNLDEAERNYLQIPSQSPQYLAAQEELIWVWLRRANTARLRGSLQTLSLSLFDDKFAPEVYVVRAISNLKLCYYRETEKDFRAFLERNKQWAARIDRALETANPERPSDPDWYTLLIERSIAKRGEERSRVEALIQHSIAAALPAIGHQKHWEAARERLGIVIEGLEKNLSQQYRRQWRNRGVMMHEAIRKMQFVKIELVNQLQRGLKSHPESAETASGERRTASLVEKDMEKKLTYPFDGVVWPDELFRLRSTAANQCL